MKINNVLVETVVCSGAKGKEARMKRMLDARQEFKKRQNGCISAWVGQSTDGQPLFIVQSIFEDKSSWKRISELVSESLDSKDGGLEAVFGGPPLVGMFETTLDSLTLKFPTDQQ